MKNLYMVTGFLGSGKTTFLNEFITCFTGRKFALVINEFGSTDVDGSLFDETGIDVSKISNGSILCSCRSDRFIETMLDLSKTDVSDVIVETSGISDISVLGKILDTIAKLTKNTYKFKGLITIADCTGILKTASTSRPVKGQLVYADYIILNKTDLCTPEKTDKILQFIKEINPFCPVEKTSFCKIADYEKLLNLQTTRDFTIDIQDVTSPWLDKFTLWFQKKVDLDPLKALIEYIAPSALRIKGFTDTDQGFYFVDGVQDSIQYTRCKPHDQSFLVVIYEHAVPLRSIARKKLDSLFEKGTAEIE